MKDLFKIIASLIAAVLIGIFLIVLTLIASPVFWLAVIAGALVWGLL